MFRKSKSRIPKKGFSYLGLTWCRKGKVYKCNHCTNEIKVYDDEQQEALLDNGCGLCGNLQLTKEE